WRHWRALNRADHLNRTLHRRVLHALAVGPQLKLAAAMAAMIGWFIIGPGLPLGPDLTTIWIGRCPIPGRMVGRHSLALAYFNIFHSIGQHFTPSPYNILLSALQPLKRDSFTFRVHHHVSKQYGKLRIGRSQIQVARW